MEIININVPKGTKEATLKVADKEVILHFNSKEFKKGDIIVREENDGSKTMLLFDSAISNGENVAVKSYTRIQTEGKISEEGCLVYAGLKGGWLIDRFRLATSEEKDYFIATLEKNGYTLDSNSNLIKKKWRANLYGSYFFITLDEEEGLIIEDSEDNISIDDYRFSINNYFKTEKEAKVKLDKILSILKED